MSVVAEVCGKWQFDSDSKDFRLTFEAYRISVAHLLENYIAIHSSLIDPLPHQISAVYEKMLLQKPLRFVLADDPGAGKTVMAGLMIKELIIANEITRCLIVCPGTLVEQWQDELQNKFQLQFEILKGEKINLSGFSSIKRGIVGMDILARNEDFQKKLQATSYDLIIVDEAHKMSATIWGNKIEYTKRFKLGKLLGKITHNFLLMTATPHNGKEEDFQLFMSLIDADRFEGVRRIGGRVNVSDIMRRLVKEDLLTFDGKPLFPERLAYTVSYTLSPPEMQLYEKVTAYVSDGFNRAEKLNGSKKNSVGFAMTILQRRLASSPQAIYKSLSRRTERLKNILHDKNLSTEFVTENPDEESGELELTENEISERATAAVNIAELQTEIETLESLTKIAKKVFQRGEDKKWQELSKLLQSGGKFLSSNGEHEKLIIFTEHRDTLDYLQRKISVLFGRAESVAAIHGGLNHRERLNIQEKFMTDKNIFVLVATDAAGEGINLQNAHLMINYDLPWNPNRLEQRFGRIHRIGQKNICHLWNLVAGETREGQVYYRLLKKLENERLALGGKVFDILGKVSFDNKPLHELLIEAIRYGNNSKILETVDESFSTKNLNKILKQRALTEDKLDIEKVVDINQKIERGEIGKLQPYFIEKFFITAFKRLGGQIYRRENNRYEILHVPAEIFNKFPRNSDPVAKSYSRVCFDKKNYTAGTEILTLGHPLLKAVVFGTLEKFGETLKRGTILVDDNNANKNRRLLFYVEVEISDGQSQILSKKIHFIEILENGQIISTNSVPYLDYNSPTDDERLKVLAEIKNMTWLKNNLEEIAINYIAKNLTPPQLQEIFAQKKSSLDKLETEIRTRLHSEISYWDARAADATDNLNIEQATRRVDELTERLNRRLSEIKLQRKIFALPPRVIGGALIVPRGYFNSEIPNTFTVNFDTRSKIEKIAMDAVTKIEKSLGNIPTDCSLKKCGYDIESVSQDKNFVRFIEVKGRTAAASTLTITTNEILTALNAPENFILAIVTIDGNAANVVYLKKPFTSTPDFAVESSNFKISKLRQQAEILLERKIILRECKSL